MNIAQYKLPTGDNIELSKASAVGAEGTKVWLVDNGLV